MLAATLCADIMRSRGASGHVLSQISVSAAPGMTSKTRMPCARFSARSTPESAPSPALDAEKALIPAKLRSAATDETFTMYSGFAIERTDRDQDEQPGGPSKMCLSCHDGVTAVDAFGGGPESPSCSPVLLSRDSFWPSCLAQLYTTFSAARSPLR